MGSGPGVPVTDDGDSNDAGAAHLFDAEPKREQLHEEPESTPALDSEAKPQPNDPEDTDMADVPIKR
jgi:hypothetical protein